MDALKILTESNALPRLMGGLAVTVRISVISVILSIPLGIIMGILMTSKNKVVRAFFGIYLNFIRVMPQLVLLYLVFFGTSESLGINISSMVASIIVFTLWGAAELGDLVRGALESIPSIQFESAYVLGLTDRQIYMRIILPQALKRLLPPTVNLITRIIKTTSLTMLIGVVELVRVGQQVIDLNRFEYPMGALVIYAVIALMYFAVCWPLSLLARHLEKGANS